tara:strand:- start:11 stop:1393 length:1383 start_codon:yes stop_codon:yes gene_type:complete
MSLSQKQFADFRKVCEEFNEVEEIIEEELVHEICDELIEELIEEGYSEEEAIEVVDEATDLYIDETLCEVSDSYYDSAVRASKKSASGIDKAARQKRRAGQVRYAKRKAGDALKGAVGAVKGAVDSVKKKASAAKAGVQIAGSIAKDEARRAGRKAALSVSKAPEKAKAAASDAKKKAKSGIKGFIKRQAQKVVNRMSEEIEALKATGLFTAKEIKAIVESENVYEAITSEKGKAKMKSMIDARTTDSGRAKSGKGQNVKDIKHIGRANVDGYGGTPPNLKVAKNPVKSNFTGLNSGTGNKAKRRADALTKNEELKATGKFSDKEIEAIMEADSLAAMQARREKRLAAQRKREGTTATGRDFGHDYSLTPAQQKTRRDAEFKAGIGTKKEEVEVDEAMSSYDRNRKRAAQRAADRNAARAAGKTGVVPGVGYVSPRKERETYVDSAGTTRHKSGAKMPKD